MDQIFLLGKTKTGKTTLSCELAALAPEKNFEVYEAGGWVRAEVGCGDDFSSEYHNQLTDYAMNKLASDGYYSVKQFNKWSSVTGGNRIISGVRNPLDFFEMVKTRSNNKFIIITDGTKFNGSLTNFEKGVDIIYQYLKWRQQLFGCKLLELPSINQLDKEKLKEFIYE